MSFHTTKPLSGLVVSRPRSPFLIRLSAEKPSKFKIPLPKCKDFIWVIQDKNNSTFVTRLVIGEILKKLLRRDTLDLIRESFVHR
jgi:hypothetical protein